MLIYVTSKNVEYGRSPSKIVYIGSFVSEAESVVGEFVNYQRNANEFPSETVRKAYSALPLDMDREMIQFYMYDGWWYSIEMFELEEPGGSITLSHTKTCAIYNFGTCDCGLSRKTVSYDRS